MVQTEHFKLMIEGKLPKLSSHAKASVVDQKIDGKVTLAQLLCQPLACQRTRQVESKWLGLNGVHRP